MWACMYVRVRACLLTKADGLKTRTLKSSPAGVRVREREREGEGEKQPQPQERAVFTRPTLHC